MTIFRMGLVGAGRMGRTHCARSRPAALSGRPRVADPVEQARRPSPRPDRQPTTSPRCCGRRPSTGPRRSSSDTHLACIRGASRCRHAHLCGALGLELPPGEGGDCPRLHRQGARCSCLCVGASSPASKRLKTQILRRRARRSLSRGLLPMSTSGRRRHSFRSRSGGSSSTSR